jgi:phosphoribosyl-ATP pyrophosphohydrolase
MSAPPPAPGAPSDASLSRLADVIDSRRGGDPGSSYVARLLAHAPDAVLKKIGEEATETVMAAKDGDAARIVAETADLWFHCLVMLSHFGLRPEQVLAELERRAGTSGIEEKALRKALARAAAAAAGDPLSGAQPGAAAAEEQP